MEHQSSLNPNMALRLLLYAAGIYKSLVSQRSLYSGKKLPIPRPEFFVLYNGEEELGNETELKLSDLFEEVPGHEGIDLELKVRVININLGHNEEMMARSEHLRGYAIITDKIREYMPKGKMAEEERKIALGKAIKKAIEYCVKHRILIDFLKENAGEVMNMLTMEFDINVAEKVWREEGREEGLEKGREEGREEEKEKIIKNLLSLGVNIEQVAKAAGLDVERVKDYARKC
jgi:predicted transposase YdaD